MSVADLKAPADAVGFDQIETPVSRSSTFLPLLHPQRQGLWEVKAPVERCYFVSGRFGDLAQNARCSDGALADYAFYRPLTAAF